MKALILLLFLFLINQHYALSQKGIYSLEGKVNADSGVASLLPTGGAIFDPSARNVYTTEIKKGRFLFKGDLHYPTSFRILILPNYVSSEFFIDFGKQSIICDIDSSQEIPKIINKTMVKYLEYKHSVEKSITNSKDSLFSNYISAKSKSIDTAYLNKSKKNFIAENSKLDKNLYDKALKYSKNNSDSFIVLWEIVKNINLEYNPDAEALFNSLSYNIRQTYTGKQLNIRLIALKNSSIGKIVQNFKLFDVNLDYVNVLPKPLPRYTLIDFWFSRCAPCLAEFPELKRIDSLYKNSRLIIIGISVNKKQDYLLWKSTINQNKINWTNYLDDSGKETKNFLPVTLFPSNFLIDEHGKILKKNIKPADLEAFIKGNI